MQKIETARNLSSNALPESLQPSRIPQPFRTAEQGKLEFLPPGKEVQLSGGSSATVYNLDDSPVYACVANIATRFPEVEKVAVNSRCTEKVTLLDGEINAEINGAITKLEKGAFVVLASGDSYAFTGTGRIIVVTDSKEGWTNFVKQFPEPTPTSLREDALTRTFLRFLMTADPKSNVAGAREFLNMEIDPRTCPLEMVRGDLSGDFGPEMKIERLELGPRDYVYNKKTIFQLNEGEIGVTYHWSDTAPLAGGGGSAHRRLRIIESGQLESIERDIFGVFMS